jgi:peptidoglycan-associated lipoprotein
MVKKFCIVVGVILSLMVMVSCAKKAVKEKPLVTGMAEEKAWGKPGEEAEMARIDEKSLEASLERKKYPGIEGEFLESSLLKDIHFGFDRYDLTPKAREILSQNADLLLQHSRIKIQIEGHCDERGTTEYNLALGVRRSNSGDARRPETQRAGLGEEPKGPFHHIVEVRPASGLIPMNSSSIKG